MEKYVVRLIVRLIIVSSRAAAVLLSNSIYLGILDELLLFDQMYINVAFICNLKGFTRQPKLFRTRTTTDRLFIEKEVGSGKCH